jgi:hypothetical protein
MDGCLTPRALDLIRAATCSSRTLVLNGFLLHGLSVSGREAPLAEVSPAPLGTAFPVPPGAIVSAFAAPEAVDALGVPAPCASADGDADTTRHNIKDRIVLFNLIKFSLGKSCICAWMRLR